MSGSAKQATVQQLSNLGHQVTYRQVSWLDQCSRAWGTEFFAPDHNIYQFSGGKMFDSTDQQHTGIY